MKEHLGGNEKTRKTQVFSAGYVLQTTVQSKLSDPFSVVPNAYTFTECFFSSNFFFFPHGLSKWKN